MTFSSLLGLSGAAALGAAVVGGLMLRQMDILQKRVKEKEDSIASTSKLLIEKNIELFDQNVNQQKLLASKDDFIAIASHQLRTPAAEIKWGLGALIDQLPTKQASAEELGTILKSSKKMERLIEDLLQFVTVEQGRTRLAVTPYDPDAVVKAATERIAKDFSKRSIRITTSLSFGGTIDSIDQNALEMAVSNMVENAYLYTPDPGEIVVRTKRTAAGQFEFEVEDSGMGVSPDMREKLFVKFRRAAEAQQHNTEGSGLGLYIVKTILERVGGTTMFRPRPQSGSIFGFSVPPKSGPASPPDTP